MVDKVLSKAFEKVRNLIDRVEKGQADDAPIDLPGTHKRRDTSGRERVADTDTDPTNPAKPHGSRNTETPDPTR